MTTRKKVLLTALGTLGDVFPSIGVGAALRARGHEVQVMANSYFSKSVLDAGLGFISLGTVADYRAGLANRDIWHPRRGLEALMDSLMPDICGAYEILMKHYEPGRTVVVAHPFDFSARLAQEKQGIPCATMVLSPSLFRSLHRVPVLHGDRELSSMPRVFKSLMWRLADQWIIDPAVTPRLNRARSELGLPLIRRPFDAWIYSPELTIGLFPHWFGDPQVDWPPQVVLTGFPLYESCESVPEVVEDFLEAPGAPVLFTAGSGVVDMGGFIDTAREACRRRGLRALVLDKMGQPEGETKRWEDGFLQVPFVPLSAILPRCAAFVHHGGVGTTAAALAAGVPQIIRPIAHDQPDHAARVARLGVGKVLLPRDFSASALARALESILHDEGLAENCVRLAGRMSGTQSLSDTSDLIEELGRPQGGDELQG